MENTLLRECHKHFRTEIEQQEITQGLGFAPPPPATPQSVHLFPLRDLLAACKGRASRGAGCLGAPWEETGTEQRWQCPCARFVLDCGAPGGHKQLMQQTLGLPFKTLEKAELQCSWDVTARGEALVVEEQEPGNAQGAQPGFDAAPVLGWEGKVWGGAGPGEGLGAVLEADLRAGSGDTTPQGCSSPAWGAHPAHPHGNHPARGCPQPVPHPGHHSRARSHLEPARWGFVGLLFPWGGFLEQPAPWHPDLLGTAALLQFLLLPKHQELFPGGVNRVNMHEHNPKAKPELHFPADNLPTTLCRQTCAAYVMNTKP